MYQFFNRGPASLHTFYGSNFGTFKTDVGYDPTSTGSIPNLVHHPVGGINPPIPIFFFFTGSSVVLPGENTAVLVIETNATEFNVFGGNVAAEGGFFPGFNNAFQPVPEPSSLAMLGGGALVLGSSLRKFISRIVKSTLDRHSLAARSKITAARDRG